MHWKFTSFAALSVLALAACKEEPPGTLTVNTTQGSNATGARAFFETNVFPELDKDQGKDPVTGKLRQACVHCHSVGESGAPIWLQDGPVAAYDQIDSYKSLRLPAHRHPREQRAPPPRRAHRTRAQQDPGALDP